MGALVMRALIVVVAVIGCSPTPQQRCSSVMLGDPVANLGTAAGCSGGPVEGPVVGPVTALRCCERAGFTEDAGCGVACAPFEARAYGDAQETAPQSIRQCWLLVRDGGVIGTYIAGD